MRLFDGTSLASYSDSDMWIRFSLSAEKIVVTAKVNSDYFASARRT
jgi:hypothetical protein